MKPILPKLALSAVLLVASLTAGAETYQFQLPLHGLAVAQPSCSLPWGGSIPNGQTVTAYQTASVPHTDTCSSEVRSCTKGVLSGSFAASSCVVAAPPAPTGYLIFTITFPALTGENSAEGNTLTWQNNGYQTSCSGGYVATETSTMLAQTSSQPSWGTWQGTTYKVCIPAYASDAKTISPAVTTTYLNGGWLSIGGKTAGFSAGAKKWLLSASHSRDTHGVYPSTLSRRLYVREVSSIPATADFYVITKNSGAVLRTFNVGAN